MAKILLLTPQLPYPPQQGTSLRNWHILRGLAEHHSVSLLSFLEPGQSVQSPLSDLCPLLKTVPVPAPRGKLKRGWQLLVNGRPDLALRLHSRPFANALRDLLRQERFDVVQVEGLELAWTIQIIRRECQSKIVFDAHNAETQLQRRAAWVDVGNPRRWLPALYSLLQVRKLTRFERWACEQAAAVTAVSDTDRHHLQALVPNLPVTVIPNCIDVQSYHEKSGFSENPDFSTTSDVLFTGKMDYRPNSDAIRWFAEEVWPLVRAERPSATFTIVGQKPKPELQALHGQNGITITGFVESIQPYLAGGAVYVAPFRVGSGTRLKLIEAMAAGKAIVSTPIGAEGFEVQDGQEMVLRETAEEFAAVVLHLLNYPMERERLGHNAQQFAQAYDWRNVVPQFNTVYQAILPAD